MGMPANPKMAMSSVEIALKNSILNFNTMKVDFIIEPQDILDVEMDNIRGGYSDDFVDIECKNPGRVKCKDDGKIGSASLVSNSVLSIF